MDSTNECLDVECKGLDHTSKNIQCAVGSANECFDVERSCFGHTLEVKLQSLSKFANVYLLTQSVVCAGTYAVPLILRFNNLFIYSLLVVALNNTSGSYSPA